MLNSIKDGIRWRFERLNDEFKHVTLCITSQDNRYLIVLALLQRVFAVGMITDTRERRLLQVKGIRF